MKRHIIKLSKLTIFFITSMVICAVISFLVLVKSNIPQKTLHQYIVYNLQTQFSKPITIKNISGNFFTKITMEEIKPTEEYPFFIIESLTFKLDFLRFIASFGDWSKAVSEIQIQNPYLLVDRNTSGKWTAKEFKLKSKKETPSLFKGKISIKNLSITYRDSRGWHKKNALKTPFIDTFKGFTGSIEIQSNTQAAINLTGQINSSQSPMTIKGTVNPANLSYNIDFNLKKYNLDHWSDYILPLQGFSLSDEQPELQGNIRTKITPKSKLPFWIDLTLLSKNTTFTMPILSIPATQISGKINLSQTPKKAQVLLKLTNVTGQLDNIPLILDGQLNLTKKTSNLNLSSNTMDLKQLQQFFPQTAAWIFSGNSQIHANIYAALNKPKITGKIISASPTLYKAHPKNVALNFKYFDKQLDFDIAKATYWKGNIRGNGTLKFKDKLPLLTINLTGNDLHLPDPFTGTFNILSTSIGPVANLDIQATLNSQTAQIYKQNISKGNLNTTYLDGNLDTLLASFTINDNDSLLLTEKSISAKNIPLYDIDPSSNLSETGKLQLTGHYQNIFQSLNGNLDISITDMPFYGQNYETISAQLSKDKNDYTIDKLLAKTKTETILLSGTFIKKNVKHLTLETTNLNLEKSKLAQLAIPDNLKPVAGILTSTLTLTKKGDTTQLSGQGLMTDGKIQNQSLDRLSSAFSWRNKTLSLANTHITHQNSEIHTQGTLSDTKLNLLIQKGTFIDLTDFSTLLAPYGTLFGTLQLNGTVSGTYSQPNFSLEGSLKNLQTDISYFEEIEGDLSLNKNTFRTKKLTLSQYNSHYTLSGYWPKVYAPESTYKINLNFENADLNTLAEYSRSFFEKREAKSITKGLLSKTKSLKLTPQNSQNSLDYYQEIENQYTKLVLAPPDTLESALKGSATGFLNVTSRKNNIPLIHTNIIATNFSIPYFQTQKATLALIPKKNLTRYTFTTESGVIGTTPIEKSISRGYLDQKNMLYVTKTELHTPETKNKTALTGTFPITSFWAKEDGTLPINLKLSLIDDQLNLLSLLSTPIQKITNTGIVSIWISGTPTDIRIHTPKIALTQTSIVIKNTTSPLFIKNANLQIKNNNIHISQSSLLWNKPKTIFRTTQKQNQIDLNGNFQFQHINAFSLEKLAFTTSLSINDTTLTLDLEDIYAGDITLENTSVSNNMLQSTVTLSNGTIHLPKEKKKPFPLGLNLEVNLGKDLFIDGSLLGNTALAGITTDLELEESKSPLFITGSTETPIIENDIILKEGSLSVFNLNFELLPVQYQKRYQNEQLATDPDNKISFTTQQIEDGRLKSVPVFNITALTILEQETTSENISPVFTHVVLNLHGPISELDTLRFDIFESDTDDYKTKVSPVVLQNSYTITDPSQDNQELIKIILPEFFQEEGITEDTFNTFGEKKVNAYLRKGFIRPLEKQIANRVGLYDLRIDYNIGSELFQTTNSEDKQLSLNMIKRLFSDQFYIRVKTNLDLNGETETQTNAFDLSEIELTYYLLKNKNLSFNFSQIRDEDYQTKYTPKLSLRFSHEY